MKKKVFIDGRSGTTGLRIFERLSEREDIELIILSENERKNINSRSTALNSADYAFLCLPDAAAIEAVDLVSNPNTVILDTSTAHRTAKDWTYGFPEISDIIKQSIYTSKRIAVPGCHASGFIVLVKPLIDAGIISKEELLVCNSITGYSGGGKKMINEYREQNDELLEAPRQYAISQEHKHLPEMKVLTGLDNFPIFCPVVANYYSGMEVTVPLFSKRISGTVNDIKQIYQEKYKGPVVSYKENADEHGFLSACSLSGKDSMQISVSGNSERILLTARYDNLGKGASGAAVQCMNMLMGINETQGLII